MIASSGQATASGRAEVLSQASSYDQVRRFLSEREYTSKDLWFETKEAVRKIEDENGVLIFDDIIQEKELTDENDIICWHFGYLITAKIALSQKH